MKDVYQDIETKVKTVIGNERFVYLSVDGWENHQKLPMMGFCCILVTGKSFLIQFALEKEKELAEILSDRFEEVKSKLAACLSK